MAYNSNKGPQHSGDVQYEGDPTDTQIDFENDFVALKTNGQQRFIVSGSAITASVNISGSGALTIGGNLTADDNNFRVFGNAVRANDFRTPTTQINATHISSSLNISGSKFYGDGSTLSGLAIATYNNASDNRVITSVNSNTIQGEANLTFDGTTLVLTGAIQQTGNKVRFIVPEDSNAFAIMAPDDTYTAYRYDANSTDHYFNAQTRFGANTGAPAHAVSVTGDVSASNGITSSAFYTLATVIDRAHVSSSLNISGAAFYGDGSTLSGLTAPAITTYNNATDNRVITSVDNNTVQGEANLTFDGSDLTVVGNVTASLGLSGSAIYAGDGLVVRPATNFATVINGTHVSSSLNISGAAFYGDGANLTGLTPAAITTYSNATDNRVITSVNSTSVQGEANLTFDGTTLAATGQISASLGVTGSSVRTATTVIDATHVSSSLNISGAAFYGDGANLTGLTPAAITSYTNPSNNRIITSVNSTGINAESDLLFNGLLFQISSSMSVSGANHVPAMVVDSDHISSSLNISGAAFYGDGANLTGLPAPAIATYNNATDNRVITSVNSNTVQGEANLTFDGFDLSIVGNVTASQGITGSLLLSTGSTAQIAVGKKSPVSSNMLYVNTQDNDNRVPLLIVDTAENFLFAVSGSGKVVIGGSGAPYIDGRVNITGSDSEKLLSVKSDSHNPAFYVSGSGNSFLAANMEISSSLTIRNSEPPATNNSPGTAGEIRWDANYIYVCTATDTWKRVALVGGW